MTHFSFQLRDRIFVKGYGFLFGKTLGRSIGKNISKNLSSKYSQKLIDNAKQPATDALKMASKRAIQKAMEATGDLVGNTIADRIMKISKISPKKNSEANEEKILWGRFVPSELRHKIIDDIELEEKSYDDLRLI